MTEQPALLHELGAEDQHIRRSDYSPYCGTRMSNSKQAQLQIGS